MPKEILLVMLEFDNWEQARSWSYTGSYAFIDGFRQNGHHCTLLPAIHGRAPDAPDSFIHHAETLLAGRTFDEAWIWCNHAAFDERFWTWLKKIAPVRVGVVLESLNHSDEELEALPFLAQRREDSFSCLPHCTHAIAADEADVKEIQTLFGIPTLWNVFMVPEDFIREDAPPTSDIAAFIGAAYFTGPAYDFPKAGNLLRNRFLNDPRLDGLMNRPHFQLPERSSDALARFEALHRETRQSLLAGTIGAADLEAFSNELHHIRAELFALFLEGLRLGMACVNLPTLVKAFSGRVIEAMAASVPSVSWLPPDRPECARLFENGSEVLLFDSVEKLAGEITMMRENPKVRHQLVHRARAGLRQRHTSRIRCQQYGRWIDAAETPCF